MAYVIALDCGTTSVRAMIYDSATGCFLGSGFQMPLSQSYPRPGWVEQDANELYASTLAALVGALDAAPGDVSGIGITNQRETVVAWDRRTGKPVCPAIVWQCRRTAEACEELKPLSATIAQKTGLVVDPYFSATKMRWIVQSVSGAAKLYKEGNLCLGTVDSYLIFRLTEGRVFVTDPTNVSRTMLFDIRAQKYDDWLLSIFGINRDCLPDIVGSDKVAGCFRYRGKDVPIAGVAGDQQAALFGQGCFSGGKGKITYGTGMFMLLSTGEKIAPSSCGLITTVAAPANGKITYALEGSVFNAGSCVQWLRDELGLISSSAESEEFARKVDSTGGVYFVPAFTGLGAPRWKSDAKASFTGITRGTNKFHLVRAVLESIAYSAKDLAEAMRADAGMEIAEFGVDGGASANDFLMQFQADVLGIRLARPKERESTALGAAYLCCIALGLADQNSLCKALPERIFEPSPQREKFEKLYSGYIEAIGKTCR